MGISASNESKSSWLDLDDCRESRMPKGDSTWHDCIIFDFFYSEYWHYRLVLSFCAKAEVHSFEGRVDMRLSDFCVSIYYNLSDLLHRNVENAQSPARVRTGLDRRHQGL